MNELISAKNYPAEGVKRTEFFGKPLRRRTFDMIGLIVTINPQTPISDFKLIYTGGIRIENEDGTISEPNKPFFIFGIDDKTFLSVPLYSIPSSRYPMGFAMGFTGFNPMDTKKSNGYSIALGVKSGQKISAVIEYPLHKVPLSKDNEFTVILIGEEVNMQPQITRITQIKEMIKDE
ncbi:MAG: hypothetical protein V1701_02595 [Planctomycetota bacterium]